MIAENAKIFIAGHRGMAGSAIMRKFVAEGYTNLITRTRQELDLRCQEAVKGFYAAVKPEYVIAAAAKVGGINANMHHKAEFLLENTQIQNNLIYQAYLNGVKKLCFLGSSCIYPAVCPQPIKEEYLLGGPLEVTNEGYALAKIAGYKLGCYLHEQYGFNAISLMPCNLYGTNDHFDLENSHVLSALVRRFCDAAATGAKSVTCWGTGAARREFLHVDDMAEACFLMMQSWNHPEFINVGSGRDIAIKELAEMIAGFAGFQGEIKWDGSRPDGMLLKCMDISRLTALGWKPKISLKDGIIRLMAEYREKRPFIQED
ncbi:MAG: GDP-L-fucose synthase [Victivallales bacterium]|nr:GDP-L-fucose synthase [Victivallales bacterium]